jgi:hypothetical protein
MPRTAPLGLHGPAAATLRPTAALAAVSTLDTVLKWMIRLGYVVRGIIYLLPGIVALRLALGQPGGEMSQITAIQTIGREPFGRILLIGVGLGLAGYALWGVIRAIFDPLRKGRSPGGLAQRIGFAISAAAYMGLLVATFRYCLGPASPIAPSRDWIGALLERPLGVWLVAIIGVLWVVGAGFGQIVAGWRGRFTADLATERMSRLERRWANGLGRFGTVARGVVFAIIGILMVAIALHVGPRASADMGGALIAILRQPFGRILLAGTAFGLMTFGTFSILCSRWMRIQPAVPSSRLALSHSFAL